MAAIAGPSTGTTGQTGESGGSFNAADTLSERASRARRGVAEFVSPRGRGRDVVACASACVDVLSDFVSRRRRRLCADPGIAAAGVSGSGGSPGGDCALTAAFPRRSDAGCERSGAGTDCSATERHIASDHHGQRQAQTAAAQAAAAGAERNNPTHATRTPGPVIL